MYCAIRFSFAASVCMQEVEATLRLAILAVQSLHGEDRVRLEAKAELDRDARVCVVDTTSRVSRTLALVFGGYVRREFGPEAVTVQHIVGVPAGAPG